MGLPQRAATKSSINKGHRKTHLKSYYALLRHRKPPYGGFSYGGPVASYGSGGTVAYSLSMPLLINLTQRLALICGSWSQCKNWRNVFLL